MSCAFWKPGKQGREGHAKKGWLGQRDRGTVVQSHEDMMPSSDCKKFSAIRIQSMGWYVDYDE